LDFVWDEQKAKLNLAKHGVDFATAKGVFGDPNALIEFDEGDPSEDRWRTIGLVEGRVLFVVFTDKDEDLIRIISARRATRHEQDRYYRQAFPQG
jgi:uncharacterized DUF497 family protein